MNTNIKSFKRRDAKDLAEHYAIVYYRNGQIRYVKNNLQLAPIRRDRDARR